MDLQRIVADKIQTFDTMKNSYEAAAPYAATGKSSSSVAPIHKVDVNAIVQNPNTKEYKPYQGTIRKDMTRPRSESVERPVVDYTRPLGISHRRQSTGSNLEHRSEWTRDNLQRHAAMSIQVN